MLASPENVNDLLVRVIEDFYSAMTTVALMQAEGEDVEGDDYPVERIVGARFDNENLQLAVKWANHENAT